MSALLPDIEYWPNYLTAVEADQLYQHCVAALPWRQESIRLFGRTLLQPRLLVWMGDRPYRYSGQTYQPVPWDARLKTLAERLAQSADAGLNSVLCNWYQHGQHSMGWHSDNEPELGAEPVIVSVSLGEARRFLLRRKVEPRQKVEYLLQHGDVLVMRGRSQCEWEHSVPKSARVTEGRINLTYRLILPAAP
ncbi:alpha-ketoglutarate-dependent dioxygenase AlkB [Salinispirillum sp. LH 10-3-1]|uniref:Alpha-ketoglutarate-dependent dioxygenase AlkB n=1 Tax=Salinispirillum sp. LH 10-3-1 TaxID=2952525 RepID=A0AB38YI20_9GAMM